MGQGLYILRRGRVLVLVLRPRLKRIGLPPLVGDFLIGFLLRRADGRWHLLGECDIQVFPCLGDVGIVVILFCIESESDAAGLVKPLPRARFIWVGDVAVLGGWAYRAARRWLGLDVQEGFRSVHGPYHRACSPTLRWSQPSLRCSRHTLYSTPCTAHLVGPILQQSLEVLKPS